MTFLNGTSLLSYGIILNVVTCSTIRRYLFQLRVISLNTYIAVSCLEYFTALGLKHEPFVVRPRRQLNKKHLISVRTSV